MFLYPNETLTCLLKKKEKRIQAAEMKFLRSTEGYSLLHKKRNKGIRQELKIKSFSEEY